MDTYEHNIDSFFEFIDICLSKGHSDQDLLQNTFKFALENEPEEKFKDLYLDNYNQLVKSDSDRILFYAHYYLEDLYKRAAGGTTKLQRTMSWKAEEERREQLEKEELLAKKASEIKETIQEQEEIKEQESQHENENKEISQKDEQENIDIREEEKENITLGPDQQVNVQEEVGVKAEREQVNVGNDSAPSVPVAVSDEKFEEDRAGGKIQKENSVQIDARESQSEEQVIKADKVERQEQKSEGNLIENKEERIEINEDRIMEKDGKEIAKSEEEKRLKQENGDQKPLVAIENAELGNEIKEEEQEKENKNKSAVQSIERVDKESVSEIEVKGKDEEAQEDKENLQPNLVSSRQKLNEEANKSLQTEKENLQKETLVETRNEENISDPGSKILDDKEPLQEKAALLEENEKQSLNESRRSSKENKNMNLVDTESKVEKEDHSKAQETIKTNSRNQVESQEHDNHNVILANGDNNEKQTQENKSLKDIENHPESKSNRQSSQSSRRESKNATSENNIEGKEDKKPITPREQPEEPSEPNKEGQLKETPRSQSINQKENESHKGIDAKKNEAEERLVNNHDEIQKGDFVPGFVVSPSQTAIVTPAFTAKVTPAFGKGNETMGQTIVETQALQSIAEVENKENRPELQNKGGQETLLEEEDNLRNITQPEAPSNQGESEPVEVGNLPLNKENKGTYVMSSRQSNKENELGEDQSFIEPPSITQTEKKKNPLDELFDSDLHLNKDSEVNTPAILSHRGSGLNNLLPIIPVDASMQKEEGSIKQEIPKKYAIVVHQNISPYPLEKEVLRQEQAKEQETLAEVKTEVKEEVKVQEENNEVKVDKEKPENIEENTKKEAGVKYAIVVHQNASPYPHEKEALRQEQAKEQETLAEVKTEVKEEVRLQKENSKVEADSEGEAKVDKQKPENKYTIVVHQNASPYPHEKEVLRQEQGKEQEPLTEVKTEVKEEVGGQEEKNKINAGDGEEKIEKEKPEENIKKESVFKYGVVIHRNTSPYPHEKEAVRQEEVKQQETLVEAKTEVKEEVEGQEENNKVEVKIDKEKQENIEENIQKESGVKYAIVVHQNTSPYPHEKEALRQEQPKEQESEPSAEVKTEVKEDAGRTIAQEKVSKVALKEEHKPKEDIFRVEKSEGESNATIVKESKEASHTEKIDNKVETELKKERTAISTEKVETKSEPAKKEGNRIIEDKQIKKENPRSAEAHGENKKDEVEMESQIQSKQESDSKLMKEMDVEKQTVDNLNISKPHDNTSTAKATKNETDQISHPSLEDNKIDTKEESPVIKEDQKPAVNKTQDEEKPHHVEKSPETQRKEKGHFIKENFSQNPSAGDQLSKNPDSLSSTSRLEKSGSRSDIKSLSGPSVILNEFKSHTDKPKVFETIRESKLKKHPSKNFSVSNQASEIQTAPQSATNSNFTRPNRPAKLLIKSISEVEQNKFIEKPRVPQINQKKITEQKKPSHSLSQKPEIKENNPVRLQSGAEADKQPRKPFLVQEKKSETARPKIRIDSLVSPKELPIINKETNPIVTVKNQSEANLVPSKRFYIRTGGPKRGSNIGEENKKLSVTMRPQTMWKERQKDQNPREENLSQSQHEGLAKTSSEKFITVSKLIKKDKSEPQELNQASRSKGEGLIKLAKREAQGLKESRQESSHEISGNRFTDRRDKTFLNITNKASGFLEESYDKTQANNPYSTKWFKKILKNHFDVDLRPATSSENLHMPQMSTNWKIRRVKNLRKPQKLGQGIDEFQPFETLNSKESSPERHDALYNSHQRTESMEKRGPMQMKYYNSNVAPKYTSVNNFIVEKGKSQERKGLTNIQSQKGLGTKKKRIQGIIENQEDILAEDVDSVDVLQPLPIYHPNFIGNLQSLNIKGLLDNKDIYPGIIKEGSEDL